MYKEPSPIFKTIFNSGGPNHPKFIIIVLTVASIYFICKNNKYI